MSNSFKTQLTTLNWMLFIILLGHILIFSLATSPITIAVIDAGSSGSRIHLFKQNNYKQVEEIGLGYHQNPGISTVDDFESYLKPFKDYVIQHVGKPIPIYVFATAGMRLLSNEEFKSRFEKIKLILKSFDFPVVDVQIISGENEGLYGFLSTMDLSKTPSNKLGFIDMGGASMQISYVEKKKSTLFIPEIEGGLNVFSNSWLKYGVNQAKLRLELLLTKNNTLCGVVDACSLKPPENKCLQASIHTPTCRTNLKQLIRNDNCTTLCHAGGIPVQLPNNLMWYGASEFHYAVYDTVKDNHINVKSARISIESRCRSDATFDCFGAMWTLEILDTLKIEELNIPLKIKDQEITWTRGYAVYYFYQNH